MNISASAARKTNAGTCPHGLPLGSCPICNGMGGGGGGGGRRASKPGEMTWDQCNAVWQQMLRAKSIAQEKKEAAMQARLHQENAQSKISAFAQNIANLITKINNFAKTDQINSLPKIISKPLALMAKIAVPILNIVQKTAVLLQKTIDFVQNKLADISDKLNAMFGELKNSIEKKISDRLKDFKKKIKSLFGIFEPIETEDEDKKIEEAKRMFELKTILKSVKEKFTPKNEKELEDAGS